MNTFKSRSNFQPLDLEIMDFVYEAAWAALEARRPFRDTQNDDVRKSALRKRVINCAAEGTVEFDALYDRVVATVPEPLWDRAEIETYPLGIRVP